MKVIKEWAPAVAAVGTVFVILFGGYTVIKENSQLKTQITVIEKLEEIVKKAEDRINAAADIRISIIETKIDSVDKKVDGLKGDVKTLDGRVHDLALKLPK